MLNSKFSSIHLGLISRGCTAERFWVQLLREVVKDERAWLHVTTYRAARFFLVRGKNIPNR
jgi:hypothetical protein